MSREEAGTEPQHVTHAPPEALAPPDHADALRNAAALWAEQNTRPETLARQEKLRDKVTAVSSFFDFAGKHPGTRRPTMSRAGARQWSGGG